MAEMLNGTTDPKQEISDRINRMKASLVQENEEKQQKVTDPENDKLDAYRKNVKSTITNLVKTGNAPWLLPHNGDKELSHFPQSNYTPEGLTAVWLKVREQELQSNDPRWFSRKDVFDNGFRINHNEKATIMGFSSSESVKFQYYWNAKQLTGIPPYEKNYAVSNEQVPTHYPSYSMVDDKRTYNPQETLKADLTNWINSIRTHTPYEPKGRGKAHSVAEYLDQSKSGTIFFIAKEASEISRKMLTDSQEHNREAPQRKPATVERD